MTLTALQQRFFGIGAPHRSSATYRHDLESEYRLFHRLPKGVLRSIFPGSLLLILLAYCRAGQFEDAPLFIACGAKDPDDEPTVEGWKWVTEGDLALHPLSSDVESRLMRGAWTRVEGFLINIQFLKFRYRQLDFYPVFDVSHSMLCCMLCQSTVLYYIPPFQYPMVELQQAVHDDTTLSHVSELLDRLNSPLDVSRHYQILMLLEEGRPLWLLAPQAARVSPDTVSVSRLLLMLGHDDFFTVSKSHFLPYKQHTDVN